MEHIQRDIDQGMLIHYLRESLSMDKDEINPDDDGKALVASIKPKINQVNQMINGINRVAKVLSIEHSVIKLNNKEIVNLILWRYAIFSKSKREEEAVNENFRLKLNKWLEPTRRSIGEFIDKSDFEKNYAEMEKLDSKYRAGIKTSINVMSIGEHDVAVFWAGRTVEHAVNDYMLALMRKKKIPLIDLASLSFENKIGKLNKEGYITESTFHILSAQRVDRNATGHPSKFKFGKNDSRLAISNALASIKKIDERVKRLKATPRKPK